MNRFSSLAKMGVLALLTLSACRQPTPAEHTQNMRRSVEWARVNCKAYYLLGYLPRDPLLSEKCPALVKEAP